jgi:hypothetical protein
MLEGRGRLEKDGAARRAAETNADGAVLLVSIAHQGLDGIGRVRIFNIDVQARHGCAQNAGVGVHIELGPHLDIARRRRTALGPAGKSRDLANGRDRLVSMVQQPGACFCRRHGRNLATEKKGKPRRQSGFPKGLST